MLIDGLLRVSAEQAITTGAAASTNVIDLKNFRDIAVGTDLEWNIAVTEGFTSGGAGTLAVAVQGSVDNSTYTTYCTTPALAYTVFTLGEQIVIKMPYRLVGADRPRYLRLLYTVATADMTAGAVTADLVLDAYRNRAVDSYPAGINPMV